ncbi:MAG: thioredoxin TrxC [Chromatiaceae bacterium]|nr:thioredoxin TrxC [Chromatiaceae bacterium]
MTQAVHVVCPHCDAVNRVPAERLGEEAKCGKCRAPLFAGAPLALDEGRFAKHLGRGDLPLVVDFWAPWCAPCRAMAPAFEAVARRIEPRARLIKVNTEEAQALAGRYGIRSIPTLVVFRGGREVARTSGAMDAAALENWIRRML